MQEPNLDSLIATQHFEYAIIGRGEMGRYLRKLLGMMAFILRQMSCLDDLCQFLSACVWKLYCLGFRAQP